MHPPRVRRLSLFGAVCALGVLVNSVTAQTPPSVRLEPFATGFRQPLDFRQAGDGSDRMYVVQKAGIISVLHGSQPVERPFLDLRDSVRSGGSEQGLLGLAFDPHYAANGFFYVNYTDSNGDTVVARYQVSGDPDVADPSSGAVILTQDQPFANHNGGNLVFGPDGYLYIGFGDGGSAGDPRGNGQSGGTWLGKMLRIDVHAEFPYAVPADNPFVDTPGVLPEIWALGLRNPWRYTFDRATGDLYVGDVGQGQWEEIDFVPAGTAGVNFGWSQTEGNHCFRSPECDLSAFVPAVAEYSHGRGDCAVIGGYVYRGSTYPALQGVYLYADECSGRMWSLTRDATGAWSTTEHGRTGVVISAFGEDDSGELYVTGFNDGVIYRVTAQ
jgi:glucose/arabinose dehydrogenase